MLILYRTFTQNFIAFKFVSVNTAGLCPNFFSTQKSAAACYSALVASFQNELIFISVLTTF